MSVKIIRVLFVCLGNICRSPMAEAIFRHLVDDAGLPNRFEIASAGTSDWETGERPHRGTQGILQSNGVKLLPDKRARQVTRHDLENYEYIIAMDWTNMRDLSRYGVEVRRLMEFAPPGSPLDVPDPYYTHNFDSVYAMILSGCRGLLAYIRHNEGL
jgi:protein-tyrosine phosphatase